MLPEFPRAYDAIQKVWNRVLFNAAGFSDPLISQLTVRVQREGHRAFLGESETEYKRQSVSYHPYSIASIKPMLLGSGEGYQNWNYATDVGCIVS